MGNDKVNNNNIKQQKKNLSTQIYMNGKFSIRPDKLSKIT